MIGQSQLEMNPARCWHTFGGRRIEDPQGGDTAAHPPLAQGAQGKDLALWAFSASLAFLVTATPEMLGSLSISGIAFAIALHAVSALRPAQRTRLKGPSLHSFPKLF